MTSIRVATPADLDVVVVLELEVFGSRAWSPRSVEDEFSGLGEYVNMPVRTYSTGMLMRLAFSISTSVQADILLMDEWLSVGDAEFTEKAEQRMKDVVAKSGILVLASHSPDLIAKECNRVVHLEHGRIIEQWAGARVSGAAAP